MINDEELPLTEELPLEEEAQHVDGILASNPPPSANRFIHRYPKLIVSIVTVLVIASAWLIWRGFTNRDDINNLRDEVSALEQFRDEASVELDEARAQGADVSSPEEIADDIPNVEVPPPGPTGERGEAGPPGPTGERGPGPTEAEVLQAVNTYCSVGDRCRGEDGRAPTPEEVQSAVQAWCLTNGCDGPVGATGAAGAPGATGETGEPGPAGPQGEPGPAGPQGEQGPQGEPGRAPTADEISVAVATYLTANPPPAGPPGPQGEPGPAGPTGPAGADGETPTQMTCTPQGVPLQDVPWTCTVTATQ